MHPVKRTGDQTAVTRLWSGHWVTRELLAPRNNICNVSNAVT